MGDSTLWTLAIAALTGGTAVIASWVTSRGSTQAARIQAEIVARSQRAERLRESRRAAYLDLIEETHRIGELFWEISAVLRSSPSADRSAALRELYDRELAEYAKMRRCARVVELEGPPSAAAAALALQKATGPFFAAFKAELDADADAERTSARSDIDNHEEFDAAYHPFWKALEDFVDAARDAHQMDEG
ncbi:hypothetical protein FCH28_25735 [Streptomyces piniterrae]|uniref:Uncharacterized protein n=1 Tax=Streptomyces piniterrae TaxID=2571125 RepID=A0A4U0N7E3_9ACTN|nr:hypothetical protein [Streptomyces piniterrae]TJZ49675.1 hypothetical protein FCH28_25735 [Streptomyces piniterrae]